MTGIVRIKGEIDGAGSLQGTGFIKVTLRGQSAKSKGPITLDVTPDPDNDGTWDLNVDVVSANGVNLRGMGDAVLATGRIVENLKVKGKYNAKKDRSKMNLKNARGVTIEFRKLQADSTSNTYTGGWMKYSILGQQNKVGVNGCPSQLQFLPAVVTAD